MIGMTFEELLHRRSDPVPTGSTRTVDADMTLEEMVLVAVSGHFDADEFLVGLAVLASKMIFTLIRQN